MTTVTIDVPDSLLAKVAQQNLSIQEVVIAVLDDAFGNGWGEKQITIPSEEDAIRHLYQTGFLAEGESLNDELANEWDSLSEEEKQAHLDEVGALVLKDSPLSQYIIENRR